MHCSSTSHECEQRSLLLKLAVCSCLNATRAQQVLFAFAMAFRSSNLEVLAVAHLRVVLSGRLQFRCKCSTAVLLERHGMLQVYRCLTRKSS